jgi:hypothetical protein
MRFLKRGKAVKDLCGIFEVRIRASRAINANITRHGDVRTAVRLTHHCNDDNLKQTNRQCRRQRKCVENIHTPEAVRMGFALILNK